MATSRNNAEDSILIDYFKYTKIYQSKYGDKTIVFMQVGAFFEVYSIKHPIHGSYEITKIIDFSEICNLNIAEKKIFLGKDNKQFVEFPQIEESTPEVTVTRLVTQWLKELPECKVVMAGVRDYQIDKYIQKMTDNGFTVVVFVQEKDARNIIKRKLQQIYSPGTFLSYENDITTENSQKITNHIMCIWIDIVKHRSYTNIIDGFNEKLICGVSCLNIFNGETHIFEYETSFFMNPTTFDELERNISTFSPKELIIISELPRNTIQTILKYIGISSSVAIHNIFLGENTSSTHKKQCEKALNCTKQTYIQQILTTFYNHTEVLETCMEFQTYAIATQSFCYLLNFIQEHNPDLIKKIHMPSFSNTSNRMILANHTLKQLNIINDNSTDSKSAGVLSSVSTFLNKCCTTMGKRKFQYEITHPIFDISWLENEYNMIDYVKNNLINDIDHIRKCMKCSIKDLERIGRQIIAKRIYPSGIVHLYETVKYINHIHNEYISNHPLFIEYLNISKNDFSNSLNNLLGFLHSNFLIEKCGNVNSITTFEENIIQNGISKELDTCLHRQNLIESLIQEIRTKLTQAIFLGGGGNNSSNKEDFIKIHETEKSGISFQTTKKRSKILKDLVDKNGDDIIVEIQDENETVKIQWKDIKIINASSNYDEINFTYLSKQTKDLHILGEQLNGLISATYLQILDQIENNWYDKIEDIIKYITNIDVIICKTYLAIEYNYCRPEIDLNKKKAYVNTKGLRHCLIEHLQKNEIYVTNDVYLGENDQDGILLYGTNAVGKTSIIRALGIAVIMAQSGCYVPCKEFKYIPYKSIYSRILGNDNIFKGLSTFAVEMSELRMILKMADENSLILGDELCSGTEIDSALSIFMSGLIELSNKQSSFIFATHFHEILNFEEMHELNKIKVKHMSVVYDNEVKCLVYDRKIKDGPGNRMYGLEVCKSLFLPNDFLERAYDIRNKYCNSIQSNLESPISKYNADKIRGICELCNVNMGQEIHHLQWQKDADSNGFIGHFHKNHKANLLSVCEQCHDKFHLDSKNETSPKKKRYIRKKTTNGYICSEI